MASNIDSSFNWNIPATYVVLVDIDDHESLGDFTSLTRVIKAPPPSLSDNKEISNFIETHNLQHGDIVNIQPDYRYSESYIVNRDPTTKDMGWIRNPDDPAAGYLTIPGEILQHVDDFISKYKNVITNEDIVCVNFHISPKDKYINKLFGENHPFGENWEFDIDFVGNENPESIRAKPKDRGCEEALDVFQLTKINGYYSSEDAMEFFALKRTRFKIKVSLEGQKLEEYKSKYGTEGSTYGWLGTKPDLPKYWTIGKGQALTSQAKHEWDWILEGPETTTDEARANLEAFLQGFTYHYVQSQQQN